MTAEGDTPHGTLGLGPTGGRWVSSHRRSAHHHRRGLGAQLPPGYYQVTSVSTVEGISSRRQRLAREQTLVATLCVSVAGGGLGAVSPARHSRRCFWGASQDRQGGRFCSPLQGICSGVQDVPVVGVWRESLSSDAG